MCLFIFLKKIFLFRYYNITKSDYKITPRIYLYFIVMMKKTDLDSLTLIISLFILNKKV